ncbi:related to GDSL lipase/acylhydrolase family protein [Ramularia collo-cygni]|uniref:Related to GDSL lipase/acylhydrolase family protein n=1 Tax=Ramularia collo-cygni TaxID=112498 RepID=A0A2D3UT69_9PEZI|nr:related to GDSL lipase/acylhydrolase family protein [Ramularia collo-cygni]CZT19571.1 related to GDSL lipase/acylhydrolase family protein [Ramularia collo-cygni]
MLFITVFTLALASLSNAQTTESSNNQTSHLWGLKKFTSWCSFGDSYTDDSRLSYFINNNGSAPPVGWVNPANYNSASGGRQWPQYVKQYSGLTDLYNYAVAGAVCSNNLIKRTVQVANGGLILFPDVENYEIPAFIADSQYTGANGTKFMAAPQDETVYSMWIGTNDLGSFVGDTQVQGKNLVDYFDCVFAQLQALYDHGGRYFVIQNIAPLNLAPMYALPEIGGVGNVTNRTETSYRMLEQAVTSNAIYEYRTAFAARIGDSFQGAHFAVMDMHGLISDMYEHPEQYLNGTAPVNVTSYAHQCNADRSQCVTSDSPDSFLWYDELHPSEQAGRTFAKTFIDVVMGTSRWATYWSA